LYSDFTGLSAGLSPGNSYNINLTPGYSNKAQREFWRIWIDFNGDGDFEDADEQVFVANNKKGQVSGSISIPSYASGQTRMRITMKNGSSPSPCESFGGGEVEDYTVDFGNGPTTLVKNSDLEMNVYPNPTKDILNIDLQSTHVDINLKVYDALGKIINDFDISDLKHQIDLSEYSNGIYYIGADNGEQNVLKRFIKE